MHQPCLIRQIIQATQFNIRKILSNNLPMKKLIAFILTSSPFIVSAQGLNDINSVAAKATNIGNLIVQLAISLAVVWIIVSIVRYLIASNDPEKRKAGGFA